VFSDGWYCGAGSAGHATHSAKQLKVSLMSCLLNIRAFARSLTLVSAAALLHIGAAVAVDSSDGALKASAQLGAALTAPTGDAQQQARQLLLGITSPPSRGRSSAASGVRATGDAQEQARQRLLGITSAPSATAPASTVRATGDAQEQARQLLHSIAMRIPAQPRPDVSRTTANRRDNAAGAPARAPYPARRAGGRSVMSR